MLISNYPDAQAAAERAGSVPGFGKAELRTPKPAQHLTAAIGMQYFVSTIAARTVASH